MLLLYAITDVRPTLKGLRALKLGPAAWVVVKKSARKPSATPAALVAYDRVVRRIASAVPAVLPFRFGSAARDEDDVRVLLAPLVLSIAGALDRTRGCVQLTLRVHGEPKKEKTASRQERPRGGPGTRWLVARREALRVPEIDPVTTRTKPYVRETRSERHAPPRRGRHVATVYHLVPREEVAAWRRAVEDATTRLDGVTITTSGPWPPYAFAELP